MTRYIRELRITIHDMYGNYKNTPNYEVSNWNPTDRALGIKLYGNQASKFLSGKFNFLGFIRKIEERGWEVLSLMPEHQEIGRISNMPVMRNYVLLEIRKIEEIDIEPDTSVASCDFCPKARSHHSETTGLDVCPDHYRAMGGKKQPECSCQETGEHCCPKHSQEPDVGVLAVNPKNFPAKIKKQSD